MYSPKDGSEKRLNNLFRAYRDACPAPEPSVNFMPELWQRIEARRSFTYSLRRWTGAFVTASLAFSLLIGAYTLMPHGSGPAYEPQHYVEALAAANAMDLEPAALEAGVTSQVY